MGRLATPVRLIEHPPADGTRAVLVRAGQLRVADTRVGVGTSRARLTPLRSWTPAGTPVRYVVPVAWESADRYLAVARDDRIVTERGPQDITRP